MVEASILLAASRGNPTVILKEAAATYGRHGGHHYQGASGVCRKGEGQEGGTTSRQGCYESSLKSAFRGAVNQPPLLFCLQNLRRKTPLWFLPAPSSRQPAPARRFCAAGVEFLLLHLPLRESKKAKAANSHPRYWFMNAVLADSVFVLWVPVGLLLRLQRSRLIRSRLAAQSSQICEAETQRPIGGRR